MKKKSQTLDKEDRDVVSNNIMVAFLCIKFDGKSSNITNSVGTAAATEDCREADKDGCLARRVGKESGVGEFRDGLLQAKDTVCARTPCVNNSLWDPLVIESVDLARG